MLPTTHEEVIEIDGLVCHESKETETGTEGRKEDDTGFAGESVTLKLSREFSMGFLSAREYCAAVVCYVCIEALVNTHYTSSPIQKIHPESPCHFGFHVWGICEGGR